MTAKFYKCRAPLIGWKHKTAQVIVSVVCRWRKCCKPRNVAVQEISTGFMWVRPFRGMRKTTPMEVIEKGIRAITFKPEGS